MIHVLPHTNEYHRYSFWLKVRSFFGVITSASPSDDLGGERPLPGVYASDSIILIKNGDLTLDAKGDPNAVWRFTTKKCIITRGGAGGNILLKGGAQPKNVFWETRCMIHIGTDTSFSGNLKSTKPVSWKTILSAKVASIFNTLQQSLRSKYSLKA